MSCRAVIYACNIVITLSQQRGTSVDSKRWQRWVRRISYSQSAMLNRRIEHTIFCGRLREIDGFVRCASIVITIKIHLFFLRAIIREVGIRVVGIRVSEQL